MKKVFFGVLVTLAMVLIVRSCVESREEEQRLQESSLLIREQLRNVSKLIVTEGHFSEVYTYKDSRQLFGPFLSAEKKALVVVNADVTVGYDLAQLKFEIDEANKTLYLQRVPEPQITLNPDFEYYDIRADYLNPFEAADYNAIKERVTASLMRKVKGSSMIANAQNRLLSELSKLLILTNSMKWTLVYEGKTVEDLEALELIH